MDKEIWKPIKGYKELYQISNLGRVKRLCGSPLCDADRILKQYLTSRGYAYLTLTKRGVQKNHFIHRLILEAFVGPCPKGMEACHFNGVRADNYLDNLRWDTRANNHADKLRHGTALRGEKHNMVKLNEKKVRVIKWCSRLGIPQFKIAKIFNVSRATIYLIQNSKRWHWVNI